MTDASTGPPAEDTPAGLDPGTWRLAVVAGVRMDMPGDYPEVLVHEAVAPWRELAIPVGMAEGNAIAYAWRGFTTPRPLTHALFRDVLERHGVELEAVRITARRGRNFSAELDTVGPRGRQIIACRPSDALALVLRQRMPTPVLVADWVFGPEEDLTAQAEERGPATDEAPPVPPASGAMSATDEPVSDEPAADALVTEVSGESEPV